MQGYKTLVGVREIARFRLERIEQHLDVIDEIVKNSESVPPARALNNTTVIGREIRKLREELDIARPADDWMNRNNWK